MSVTDFLAWEQRQELRYEFDGFQAVAMAGGTIGHDQITFNVRSALTDRLRGNPCRPFGPNVKIIVNGRVRYPDALVICRPASLSATVAEDPVIVFEVLSESSYHTDIIEKNREYRATPSIQRYVVLQQAHMAAIVFARRGEDWLTEIIAGDDAVLPLPEIGIDIPLDEFYRDVGLEPVPNDGR